MISAGELREKVIFSEPIRVPNQSSGHTTTYIAYLNTFAKVEEVRSKPYESEGRQMLETFLKVTIRYRADLPLKNGDKMIWRGFEYIVDNIKVSPLRVGVEIMVASNMSTSKRDEVVPPNVQVFGKTFDKTFK